VPPYPGGDHTTRITLLSCEPPIFDGKKISSLREYRVSKTLQS
jgi:hypothetical protein